MLIFQVGIKFNSICLTLPEEPMVPIILRLSESPFMPIVESEEFTFLIDFTVNRNCHQNSSYSFLFKSSNEKVDFWTVFYIFNLYLFLFSWQKMFYFFVLISFYYWLYFKISILHWQTKNWFILFSHKSLKVK